MVTPYEDHQIFGTRDWYRIFKQNRINADSPTDDLVWHRDKCDREIRVVHGNGWKFQSDECLPIELYEGDKIKIKKGVYHRLIMGNDDLVLKISES